MATYYPKCWTGSNQPVEAADRSELQTRCKARQANVNKQRHDCYNQPINQPSDDKESHHVEKQKNYPTKMLP